MVPHIRKRLVELLLCAFVATLLSATVYGHGRGPLGERPLEWRTEQISQVIAGGDPFTMTGSAIALDGKNCMIGYRFNFNVKDEYAFDIDESVQLTVEFHVKNGATNASVAYDKNGEGYNGFADAYSKLVQLQTSSGAGRWQTETITLDRARFSNRGFFGNDFSISAVGQGSITICSILLKRSYTTAAPTAYGQISLQVVDENGKLTPVRIGLYDKTGRLPLPSGDAIPIRRFTDVTPVISLRHNETWPVHNRSVFYIDGTYGARLPVGDYDIVVSKGLEYHILRQTVKVQTDAIQPVRLKMKRWSDMASKGWYSGDDHIHSTRDSAWDDKNLLALTQAEDLRVANILQMGNMGTVHFHQYEWKPVISGGNSLYSLVPGQEDPRTMRHGHTIHLNLTAPVRDPEHYLSYEHVFEKTRNQGAVTGYSHVMDNLDILDGIGHRRGMAVDVPFGLVDFVEVVQFGNGSTNTWFDYLNLGFKLAPSAGTDFPYLNLPGIVRSYVQVKDQFSPQAWLAGIKRGETFATNGPMLEFSVNGKNMGSELRVKSGDILIIKAKATINPDIDLLDRLELIEHGDVVKKISSKVGAKEMELKYKVQARHGTWFVLRAQGKQEKRDSSVVALSAPVYIYVDGKGFWKPSAVPSIVGRVKEDLQQLLNPTHYDVEAWDTDAPSARYWDAQRLLLEQRVGQANAIYDDLIKRAVASDDQ